MGGGIDFHHVFNPLLRFLVILIQGTRVNTRGKRRLSVLHIPLVWENDYKRINLSFPRPLIASPRQLIITIYSVKKLRCSLIFILTCIDQLDINISHYQIEGIFF